MDAAALRTALAAAVDATLAKQLIDEAESIEEAFLLRRWKYTELDGGRFAEVAARIVYSTDAQNVSLTKSVDDCLRYIDNNQVVHSFPEPKSAIHLARVIRTIYKLRSQRGAVHVSPDYSANEIDSRLVVECVRWVLSELLRIFVVNDRQQIVDAIRKLSQFPHPLMKSFHSRKLLQSTTFTTEEEILAHLLHAEDGLPASTLTASIPKDRSTVQKALKRMASSNCREVILVGKTWNITDLGTLRIEAKIRS